MLAEYQSFDNRGLWKLAVLPPSAKEHRMMLLVKSKLRPDGTEEKVKCRGVVCGNEYRKGIDFDSNVYAPCPHLATARVMIAEAVQSGKCVKKYDVSQAFTFGQTDRRCFIKSPPGRKLHYDPDTGERMSYEILKNLYGSPSAPRRWHIELHNTLCSMGFTQSTCDPCLYGKDCLNVLVYTDDFLCTFPPTPTGHELYDELVKMLTTKYALGDDGYTDATEYIGMKIEFSDDRKQCRITQPLKTAPLLESAGMTSCRPSFTPGVPKVLLSSLDCPADDDVKQRTFMKDKPYRIRVGQLLWLARTSRPDISYQVNALARVSHNPGKAHWDASTKLIKYISHTADMGVTYIRDENLTAVPGQWKPCLWSDATWASDYGDAYDNYRSTTGWVATLGRSPVSWKSCRQEVVAQSSTESEWYAAADAAKEALFLRHLFSDLKIPLHGSMELKCDNQSTIKQSLNAVNQHNSRHIGQRAHFLRQQCHTGNLSLKYVSTHEQLGDLFTKCLPEPAHNYLRKKLGVLRPLELLPPLPKVPILAG